MKQKPCSLNAQNAVTPGGNTIETITVRVIPNSKKARIIEQKGSFYKISLTSEPKNNKANKELINFLKKKLKINTRILKGASSKDKTLKVLDKL